MKDYLKYFRDENRLLILKTIEELCTNQAMEAKESKYLSELILETQRIKGRY